MLNVRQNISHSLSKEHNKLDVRLRFITNTEISFYVLAKWSHVKDTKYHAKC